MPISPDEILLQPDQQQQLAEIAQSEGKSWNDVFADAIHIYKLTCDPSYKPDRVPGRGRGRVTMSDDFDAYLEFTESMK